MTRRILVNGRPVEIVRGSGGRFRVNDRETAASVVEVEPGVYSVILDGRSFDVRTSNGSVEVSGRRMQVEVDDPRALRHSGARSVEGPQTLAAAMPGKVVRVLVDEGDSVEAGQGVAVVEAMKMQNEVKSPKSGRIVSIAVREGTAVSAGDALVVVE